MIYFITFIFIFILFIENSDSIKFAAQNLKFELLSFLKKKMQNKNTKIVKNLQHRMRIHVELC